MSQPSSLVGRTRAPAVLLVILAAFIVLVLLGIAFGSTWQPLDRVAAVLLGGGEKTERLIVLNLRMPRVAAAICAGGAMAVAGFLLQKVTRNALASPGVLGVIDGAALGVVVFLALAQLLGISIVWQPLAAASGALLAISLVFVVAGNQAASPIRLLLFGIAVAAVFKALTIVFMLIGPIYQTSQAARWIAGAVNTANWGEVQITVLLLVPTLILTLLVARHLPPADLDETSARSVGLDLPIFRIFVFVLAAALTAIAVAFVGAVGFVGLMAPHLARLMVGRNVYAGMMGSFLLGALLLVGADLLVRVVFNPIEIPAGTVTAVIGAPYFLFLLMRRSSNDG